MPLLARKPRRRQRLLQRLHLRHMNLPPVQPRALALLRRKHLIAQRIVDHASHHLAICIRRQPGARRSSPSNHAERRKPMRKVRRPIQRIDIPAILALQPVARPLFAIDPMRRKRRLQPLANQLLARRRPPSPDRHRPCTRSSHPSRKSPSAAPPPAAQSPQPHEQTQIGSQFPLTSTLNAVGFSTTKVSS